MSAAGTILIADDEETFRESTCRLLQREGYECCGARDAAEAVETLRRARFDLLMTDIRMPLNGEMRVVQTARELDDQLPVIVITGYPSAETAIWALRMSVVDYLTKPLDFDELLPSIQGAISHSRNRRALSAVQQRLSTCLAELQIPAAAPEQRDGGDALVSIGTIRTLASCLSELLELAGRTGGRCMPNNLCHWLDCPQKPHCLSALMHAVNVLQETKSTFKSKVLADLRRELELAIGSATDSPSRN